MKETIQVCRIGYRHASFEVEGDTREEREEKAIEMANNYAFGNETTAEVIIDEDFPEPTKQTNRILFCVEGGSIDRIFADYPSDVQIFVRDFDVEGSEDDLAENGSLYTPDPNDLQGCYFEFEDENILNWDDLEIEPFTHKVTKEQLDKYWEEVSEYTDQITKKNLNVGDFVLVSPFRKDETWHCEYTGTIVGFKDRLAVVEDQDGVCVDVELHRITKEEE